MHGTFSRFFSLCVAVGGDVVTGSTGSTQEADGPQMGVYRHASWRTGRPAPSGSRVTWNRYIDSMRQTNGFLVNFSHFVPNLRRPLPRRRLLSNKVIDIFHSSTERVCWKKEKKNESWNILEMEFSTFLVCFFFFFSLINIKKWFIIQMKMKSLRLHIVLVDFVLFLLSFSLLSKVRLAKDRKKGDKIVTDSQERAYWRAYRPPPSFLNCLEQPPYPNSSSWTMSAPSSNQPDDATATSTTSANIIRKWRNIEEIKEEVNGPTSFLFASDEISRSQLIHRKRVR